MELQKLKDFLESYYGNQKFLSAKEVEQQFGISAKTILNRARLPVLHNRYIPSVKLRGGRKRYFEKKVILRLLNIEDQTT